MPVAAYAVISALAHISLFAIAGIPEPDVFVYGRVVVDCAVQGADSGHRVVGRVQRAGQWREVGRYVLGDLPAVGDTYALHVRLETPIPQESLSADAAKLGDTVHLFLQRIVHGTASELMPVGSFLVQERGQIVSMDLLAFVDVTPPCHCVTTTDCADDNGDGVRDNGCLWFSCDSGACAETKIAFADLGGPEGTCEPDGHTDNSDYLHALHCFGNASDAAAPGYACEDAAPLAMRADAGGSFGSCLPDGLCDANDVFHAIDAAAGSSPCTCPSPSPPQRGLEPRVVEQAHLVLTASKRMIQPGQRVEVEVELQNGLTDLRGFQLHIGATGGNTGRLELVDVLVDQRRSHVFAGQPAFSSFNIETSQILAGLKSHGASTAPGAYLASFVFKASGSASGEFVIDLLHGPQRSERTFLFASGPGGRVAIASTTPAAIAILSE